MSAESNTCDNNPADTSLKGISIDNILEPDNPRGTRPLNG